MKIPGLTAGQSLARSWRSERALGGSRSGPGLTPQGITFHPNWNGNDPKSGFPNNNIPDNNGLSFTQQTITDCLRNNNPGLDAIADSNCAIVVDKGCHQATAPHITVSFGDQKKCKNYQGSKRIHFPCNQC